MSVVSSKVSEGNPVQPSDVHEAAAKLGFEVREDEVDAFHLLLAAAHDTFEELSALDDWNPEVDRHRFPRKDIRPGAPVEGLGSPWSHTFTIEGADQPSTSSKKKLLSGKNIVVKDNICVADVPQLNGTDATPPWTPPMDATLVTRILKAGGRIVGTATCEALSCATVSNTAAAGPIFNPWAEGFSAGGSSSGVAALVGSQKPVEYGEGVIRIDMGVGADQGGSIRVPAAFCGLVGLKPTHGLIPYTGVASCEPILDHVGPMCKNVWDTAILLEAIAGRDGLDDRQSGAQMLGGIPYSANLQGWYESTSKVLSTRPLSGLKVGMLSEAINAPFMTDAMREEFARVSQQFVQLGATLEQISMPGHALGRSLWMTVCRQSLTSAALGNPHGRRSHYPAGFQQTMIPWTQEKWDRLPAGMRNELINGTYEAAKFPYLYQKCMNLTLKLTKDYEALFEKFDILLLPSVPFTAPHLFDRATASSMDQMSATFGQTLNTMQFNLTGHPSMVIPTGFLQDTSGKSDTLLPSSVQVVGPLWGEEMLLKFGYAYEKAFDWKNEAQK